MGIRFLVLAVVCVGALPADAGEKFSPGLKFSPEFGQSLAGKSLALVTSAPPFVERDNISIFMPPRNESPGATGSFGRFDPVDVIAASFAPEFARQYGMTLAPGKPIESDVDWSAVAAVPTDADYLLYVQNTRRRIGYRRLALDPPYWTGIGVRVTLLDREGGQRVMGASCYSDTRDRKDWPEREALRENGGQLWDDIAASLTWNCIHLFAGAFLPDSAAMPSRPRALVDPIADYARTHPGK